MRLPSSLHSYCFKSFGSMSCNMSLICRASKALAGVIYLLPDIAATILWTFCTSDAHSRTCGCFLFQPVNKGASVNVRSTDEVACMLPGQAGSQERVKYVVLDMAATTFIDATGIEVLIDLLFKAPAKLHVVLADPNAAALDILDRAGLLSKLGELHHVSSFILVF